MERVVLARIAPFPRPEGAEELGGFFAWRGIQFMVCRDFSKSFLGFRSGGKSNLLLHQDWEKMLQPTSAGLYKWEKRDKDLEATSKNAEVSETSGTSYSWRSKVQ